MRGIDKILDKLTSEIVRSKGKCEVCSKSGKLDCHHYYGRRIRIFRWDLRNLVCLCSGCHTLNKVSFHQNPEWGVKWFKENRKEDYEYLFEHQFDNPLKAWQKQELYKELKERDENLQNSTRS